MGAAVHRLVARWLNVLRSPPVAPDSAGRTDSAETADTAADSADRADRADTGFVTAAQPTPRPIR